MKLKEFNPTKYKNEYASEKYDQITFRFTGGIKQKIVEAVETSNKKYKSKTRFVEEAVLEKIEREKHPEE